MIKSLLVEVYSWRSNQILVSIGSGNGLVPNKWKAIITNASDDELHTCSTKPQRVNVCLKCTCVLVFPVLYYCHKNKEPKMSSLSLPMPWSCTHWHKAFCRCSAGKNSCLRYRCECRKYFNNLVQDCSISTVLAMKILHACTKSAISFYIYV